MGHHEHGLAQAASRRCPGCGAPDSAVVDTIRTAELAALYRGRGIAADAYFSGAETIERLRCHACDLGYFSPPCPGDARFHAQLQAQPWYGQDDRPECAYAASQLRPGQSVLEVGCGEAAFQAFLPPGVRYQELAGLELSRLPVEAHALLHPGHYDCVCAFQVLQQVPAPAAFVHACAALLAPGGLLLVAVPAEDSFLALAANAALNMPPRHVLRWSDRALRNLADREGLILKELWHAPLGQAERDWQMQTLAHAWFSGRPVQRAPLIDRRLRYRLAARLLRGRLLRDWLAWRVLRGRPELARGHTVLLVAQKPTVS